MIFVSGQTLSYSKEMDLGGEASADTEVLQRKTVYVLMSSWSAGKPSRNGENVAGLLRKKKNFLGKTRRIAKNKPRLP